MAAWDIDPPGVKGVVIKTSGIADDFEGQLTSIDTAMSGAASNSSSEIIAKAIGGFAEHSTEDITFVVHRSGQVMTAAVNATNAYIDGDLQMAATAQRSAVSAPPVSDLPGAE